MTLSNNSLNETRMSGSVFTDTKEGCWHLEVCKRIQHQLGRSWLRAIVECEADATGSNSGLDAGEGSTSE